jgi:hypothetical protein
MTLTGARGALAILLTLAVATAPVAAQVIQPYESQQAPGWTFVPRLGVGGTYEDNVTFIGRGSEPPSDYIGTLNPSADLEFLGRRGKVSLGYRGALRMYRDLNELNAFENRARVEMSRRLTRHLTAWVRDGFVSVPSTDELELGGIPFARVGARANEFSSGFDIAATERSLIGAAYNHTWVTFDRDAERSGLLLGGMAHGLTTYAQRKVSSRLALGVEYDGRYAIVDRTERQFPIRNSPIVVTTRPFQIHNVAGTAGIELSPNVVFRVGAGASHLSADLTGAARTGPYWRAGLVRKSERATLTLGYQRAYVPSYGFATTSQNEELHASLHMPLARNRFYWQAGVSYRDTDPLFAEELRLHSWWLQNIIGYAASRWLRMEVFHSRSYQDTRVAGGKVERNRIGFQIVTAAPMRLQ